MQDHDNSWGISDHTLRRFAQARKKRVSQQLKRSSNLGLHLKRTSAEIQLLEHTSMGWTPIEDGVIQCSVVLNDIQAIGTAIFCAYPLPVGQRVSFMFSGTGGFHVRGRVVGCESYPTSRRVLAPDKPAYRIRLAFDFSSVDEVRQISGFCKRLAASLGITA